MPVQQLLMHQPAGSDSPELSGRLQALLSRMSQVCSVECQALGGHDDADEVRDAALRLRNRLMEVALHTIQTAHAQRR